MIIPDNFNSIEVTELSIEKNTYSQVKIIFVEGRAKPKIVYNRRYSLDAPFNSESKYFKLNETVNTEIIRIVNENDLLNKFPPKRPPKKDGSYGEIRIFMNQKLVSRIIKSPETTEIFDELSKIMIRSLQ